MPPWQVGILEATTGRILHTFGKMSAFAQQLAWRPHGQTIAVIVTHERDILLLDPSLSTPGMINGATDGDSGTVAWSPDGKMLASGKGSAVAIWDSETSTSIRELSGHTGSVNALAWSRDGKVLVSGDLHGTIVSWNPNTGQKTRTLEGHTGPIAAFSFSSDGAILASTSWDDTVKLWRTETGDRLASLDTSHDAASAWWGVAFHPVFPLLATLDEKDTVIHLWDVDYDTLLGTKVSSVHYTTAKIALVGDSGVGKTGLGWRLSHGEFKEHASTHGQQFWAMRNLCKVRKDGTECEAVLWDLAGQPDYRLVHALFLDDVDLPLVVFDPTNREDSLKGVEYWLRQLSRRKEVLQKTVLVGARTDRGSSTLTREEILAFCERHGLGKNYVETSALEGKGIDELTALLKALAPWEDKTPTVTTAVFKRIKDFVLNLKETSEQTGVLLGMDELRNRLKDAEHLEEYAIADVRTAVRHLANHGYVTVLRRSSGQEMVLLAPDVLSKLASSFVLEARRNPKELGALEEFQLLSGGYAFPELSGLSKPEQDVLLDGAALLFLEHNICFRSSTGSQTYFVFPSLINLKRPMFEDIETVDDGSYSATGSVENLYAALVVQLGYTSTFTRTNQWQGQAQYEMAPGEMCGFRQIEEREGEMDLVLYYALDTPHHVRLLFEGLFEKFLRARDVKVTKYPPVRCPKCDYPQQRTEIVKRIKAGDKSLFCSNCGKKIKVPTLTQEAALSSLDRERLQREQQITRLRTQFESALVRVKGFLRDSGRSAAAPTCFVSYAWGDKEHEAWVAGFATDLKNAGIDVVLDQWDNSTVGSNIARFVSRIEGSNFIAVVGTPQYRQKYENKVSKTGSVVAAEVDLIHQRLLGTEQEKATVLPLLLSGDKRESLPPLLRGGVYSDFREQKAYFAALFELILSIYRLPFDNPTFADLRKVLRGDDHQIGAGVAS